MRDTDIVIAGGGLASSTAAAMPGRWQVEASLETVADWQPQRAAGCDAPPLQPRLQAHAAIAMATD